MQLPCVPVEHAVARFDVLVSRWTQEPCGNGDENAKDHCGKNGFVGVHRLALSRSLYRRFDDEKSFLQKSVDRGSIDLIKHAP